MSQQRAWTEMACGKDKGGEGRREGGRRERGNEGGRAGRPPPQEGSKAVSQQRAWTEMACGRGEGGKTVHPGVQARLPSPTEGTLIQ